MTISKPFRMGQTEITNAQFEAFRPEHKTLRGKNSLSKEDDEAVVYVSYDDAVAFCEWLSQKEGKTYDYPPRQNGNTLAEPALITLSIRVTVCPEISRRTRKSFAITPRSL